MLKIFRLFIVSVIVMNLAGCFTPEGTLRIKTDRDGLELFVDGERKIKVNQTFLEVKLEVGVHKLKVEGVSDDGEWRYIGEKEVEILKDALVEINVSTSRKETEKRIARIEKERLEKKLKQGSDRIARLAKEEWKKRMNKKAEK